MLTKETTDYGYAVSHTPIAPALDLEEFLEKREWESSANFSDQEQLILNQGRTFLRLAMEGREIGLNTVREGRLGVDLPAIKAYLLSYKAYRQSHQLRGHELDEVLKVTDSVLKRLISNPKSSKDFPSGGEVEIARYFFLSLSTVPIKSNE
jgi:hypothetical protein